MMMTVISGIELIDDELFGGAVFFFVYGEA